MKAVWGLIGHLRWIVIAGALHVSAWAQFTLIETGGTFRTDAVNLARSAGAVAFGKDELAGANAHYIAKVNDGLYGNASSWIGYVESASSTASWVGVQFSSAVTIASFAFGRDNLGGYTDRTTFAPYLIQYSTDASYTTWTTVGTIDHTANATPSPALRHLYDLDPAAPLTGVFAFRISTSSGLTSGNAIDEIELYATSAAIPEPTAATSILSLAALVLGLAMRRKTRPTSRDHVS